MKNGIFSFNALMVPYAWIMARVLVPVKMTWENDGVESLDEDEI